MASNFRPDTTPVIFYGPRAHTRTRERAWLLWPAYAYRVVAPSLREHEINILQKAVLGLHNAGEIDLTRIASWLQLDTELVTVIIDELRERKLLDSSGCITPQGKKLLANEGSKFAVDGTDSSVSVGYVFQDPWNGALWPRFVERLNYQEIEVRDRQIFLIFGSKGKVVTKKPFVKRVDGAGRLEPPDVRDILRASHNHQRAQRFGRYYDSNQDVDVNSEILSGVLIDRVSIISETPEPCFLTSYIYLPADATDMQVWFACDPFGLYANADFHRWIGQQFISDSSLEIWVNNILQKAGSSLTQVGTNHQTFQDLTVEEIDKKLGALVKDSSYYEQLVAMERTNQEARACDNCPPDKLGDVAVKAGIVLEAVFRQIQQDHPANNAHEIFMTSDRQHREELINGLAQKLGFRYPLPRSLLSVKPEAVRYTAEQNIGSLLQRVVLALLTAHRDGAHPLCEAAKQDPLLFDKIAEVADIRNQSAHAGKTKPTIEQIERQVAHCYRIILAVFPVES